MRQASETGSDVKFLKAENRHLVQAVGKANTEVRKAKRVL